MATLGVKEHIGVLPPTYNERTLPYTHSTPLDVFREKILPALCIEPQLCSVFHTKLTYLFYGKAPYVVRAKIGTVLHAFHNPVCLIFKPGSIPIKRAFPFDSGAFHAKHSESDLSKHLSGFEIDKFEIGETEQDISAYIAFFYNTNNNYLSGNCVRRSEIDPLDSNPDNKALQLLLHWLCKTQPTSVDRRGNTIEVITEDNLNISSNIEAIIAPESYMVTCPRIMYIALELEKMIK
jgi:hypothetical protein